MAPRTGSSRSNNEGGRHGGRGRGGSGSSRGGRGGSSASAHVEARQRRRANGGPSSGGGGPKSIHDVFEYASEQIDAKGKGRGAQRRLNRALVNDAEDPADARRDAARAAGARDDDDDEEEQSNALRAKGSRTADYGTAPILGDADSDADGHGQMIASEDDEEIDSDEAFDESDEERYADWKFASDRKKPKQANGRKDDNDDEEGDDGDESSEEDNDEDDAGMMDLSKMLDGDSGEDDSGDAQSDSEDEEENEKLQRHVDALFGATYKRSADDAALPSEGTAGKRRVLQDRTEAVPEGEWNAPTRRGASSLSIDDLMKGASDQAGTSLTALRSKAKTLRPSGVASGGKEGVASKRGGGTLSAPLPTIVQDRLDRSAAYQETKAEVEGWQPTIKRVREAEHLSFPLQPEPVMRPSTAALTSSFTPSNVFEQDIASLLQREGVTDKQMAKAEELKMNERGMSADEVRQRTAELRRMRELLFREEQKAKRVSKIKSKTYRRIARKQKQREMDKAREAGLSTGQDGDEEDDEARMKAERSRAQERATLKHKNAGKWAKNLLGAKGLQDMPEARQAMEEQLLRGEQLRRRVHADGSDDSDDDDIYSDSEAGSDAVRTGAQKEMASFADEMTEQDAQDQAEKDGKKGIWGMKFMREAKDRQARGTQEEVDAFVDEMEREDEDDAESSSAEAEEKSMQLGGNAGRRVYGTNSKAKTDKPRNIEDDQDSASSHEGAVPNTPATGSTTLVVQDVRKKQGGKKDKAIKEVQDDQESGANPWLTGITAGMSKVSRKNNEAVVSKNGTAESKAANKVKRHVAKGDAARKEEQEDAELFMDPSARLELRDADAGKGKKAIRSKAKPVEAERDDDDSDSDSGDSAVPNEPVQVSRHAPTAMQQRQLVAEAFAGDDVMADFAAEKAAMIEADAPQTVDNFLPGWGSWGGKGVRGPGSKKQEEERKARFAKKTAGLDPTKRKDAGMANVIINQTRDKKAERYKSSDVPYPYTSRAQYEMAMRNPLGPEWNTRTQHQRLTLPRVVTKPGKAIKPIEKMFN